MKVYLGKSYGLIADKSMATWIQLLKTFKKIRAKEAVYIKSFDLTMNQFEVLEVLYHRGDLSIGEITKLTLGTPGNITVVIKNLIKNGYINSIPNPKDKRFFIISITQKGIDVMDRLFPSHAKNFENYFEVLNDEETETLFKLLRKLHKSQ
ncbi:winged helix-turn-helix transcriptional regulator [Sulfurimonas lithotrophica]|uniref:Winged helix-turn-helix transcriptional regulator n=1 Tax=Sulfurimonas lithotrophica TaxID=2590022 RepID=A0A5P8P1W0_9BACT|nr:MarR family winged helix-turn-helix transcriptional regulator [Sulfurimonas lithotrophica]QFR49664.1 winged helix-turn-helix transcriptional regulator [Sulfurimonas lithotrophica]